MKLEEGREEEERKGKSRRSRAGKAYWRLQAEPFFGAMWSLPLIGPFASPHLFHPPAGQSHRGSLRYLSRPPGRSKRRRCEIQSDNRPDAFDRPVWTALLDENRIDPR